MHTVQDVCEMFSMKKILLSSIISILMVSTVLAAGPGGVHDPGTSMGSPTMGKPEIIRQ